MIENNLILAGDSPILHNGPNSLCAIVNDNNFNLKTHKVAHYFQNMTINA